MQSLSDDERKAVLGEILADELKVILEFVKDVPKIKRKVDSLNDDMKEVKADVKIIKAAAMTRVHNKKTMNITSHV